MDSPTCLAVLILGLQGKYDVALQAYKKGRYILASRPAQLLGLPAATTPQQQAQQKRIYDKVRPLPAAENATEFCGQVWGQVEKIIGDMRATLGKRLRDTKRGIDEVEKTIECVLPVDPAGRPAQVLLQDSTRARPYR